MPKKEEKPKHVEFYEKSDKTEQALEETLRQTRLHADTAHVEARRDLLKEKGTLDLTDRKNKDYFADSFSKYLVKTVMPELYKELGVGKPGTDPKYSKRFVDMILQNYAGVNRQIVKRLIDDSKDASQFVDSYLQRILPRHLQQMAQQYRTDAHEHIYKADTKDKKGLLKSTGLDKILDEAGQEMILHKSNAEELGRLIREHKKQGGLTSDYVRQTSEVLNGYITN